MCDLRIETRLTTPVSSFPLEKVLIDFWNIPIHPVTLIINTVKSTMYVAFHFKALSNIKWVARGTISVMGENRHNITTAEYQGEFTEANGSHPPPLPSFSSPCSPALRGWWVTCYGLTPSVGRLHWFCLYPLSGLVHGRKQEREKVLMLNISENFHRVLQSDGI